MSNLIVEKDYLYTECGLKNVHIGSVNVLINDHGEKVYRLGNLKAIHTAIALAIATKPFRITSEEIRFLRKHMRLTQAALGELLHKSRVTASRWESDALEMEPNTETVLRLYALEGIEASGLIDMSTFPRYGVTEISKFPESPSDEDFEINIKFNEATEEVIYMPAKRRA